MAKRVVKLVLSTALVWAVANMIEHHTARAFAAQAAVARVMHPTSQADACVEQ